MLNNQVPSSHLQINDPLAIRGLSYVLETEKAEEEDKDKFGGDNGDDWASSSKMRLLLLWARLVAAHYGVQVRDRRGSFLKQKNQACLFRLLMKLNSCITVLN